MEITRRTVLAGLGAFAARALAQENDPKFSSDVRVVNVLASVRDKQGKFVSTLNQSDFAVSEDGHEQQIRYFSRETDLPLVLGLLVDTSLSQRRVLGQEKSASVKFLDKILRADRDRTFVLHFDKEAELLQDLTSNRADLERALDELALPPGEQPQMSRRGQGGGGGGYPGGGGGGGGYPRGGIGFPGGGIGFPGGGGRRGGGGYPRGGNGGGGGPMRGGGAGTTLYDAVYLSSNEITKKEKGRKALIVLTDGVDQGSKIFLNDAIEAAQRADTLVYSILFSDEQAYQGMRGGGGNTKDGKNVLERMSRETGGSFFEVTKKLSIDDIYGRIEEELRNQYSLGYSSDNTSGGGAYRTIKVTVRKSGLTVQTREGYYPTA